MKCNLKLIFLSIFYFQLTFAQSQKLRGVVLEESSKGTFVPLVGAPVYWLNNPAIGVITDTSGVFTIEFIDNNIYNQLVISYLGYTSDTVFVKGNERLRIILASQNTKELTEVEIIERLSSTSQNTLSALNTKIMSEKELFKAACCNLSESFETNPSIDVNFADAVTGAKQIQILGLSGIYTQLTTENMPDICGLASTYGLSYIPGPWIESIQVTKGIGSVANGYESMTGQINIELKKPDVTVNKGEKVYANAYLNSFDRLEANLNIAAKINQKWSTATLLHGDNMQTVMDFNKDNFMDMPMGKQFNVINRWKYENKNWVVQFGGKLLIDERMGGQYQYYDSLSQHIGHGVRLPNLYTTENRTQRGELFGKIGYVFPNKKYKSMGLQMSGTWHKQEQYYGRNTYLSEQRSAYLNFIYQSIIGNTNHKFRVGSSFKNDTYLESYFYLIYTKSNFALREYYRNEIIPGGFGEYTWTPTPKLTLIGGLRTDYHNLFGLQISPRLHGKYDITEKTQIRFSGGRGFRTANIIADNFGYFISDRSTRINENYESILKYPYGIPTPEIAWNYGLSLSQDFRLNYRKGTITLDYYRTDFEKQVVADIYSDVNKIQYYVLSGQSYANSFQAEINYELFKRLDVRMAYRFYDVQSKYIIGWQQRPFISKHRFFVNVAYETKSKWKFDATLNWNGPKLLPQTAEYAQKYSPDFFTLNAQISKSFGNTQNNWFDVYLGVENLTGFRQEKAIINVQNPFSQGFDAAQIWGPITGAMVYVGARYKWK
ncbi:MAG: TonB-dependent receptor [Cytophagales bacterium]|nr:MAG: TonB-dependent receptor [Cytophagales bacterium]